MEKQDFDALRVLLMRVDLKGAEVNSFVGLLNKLAAMESQLAEAFKKENFHVDSVS